VLRESQAACHSWGNRVQNTEGFVSSFEQKDTGNSDALPETAKYFAAVERRRGLKVACPKEVAYRMGYIDVAQIRKLAERYNGDYRTYLQDIDSEFPHTLQG
jgi:glucose-1-phosphate thymidylyltransferase